MSDITERELTTHNQVDHWFISQIVSDRDIRLIREVECSWK